MIIFKYEIPLETSFEIELPVHSKILSFQVQRGKPYIWVLLDPQKAVKKRYFSIVGTGHDFDYHPDTMRYIGTVQMAEGDLIWHLFEDLI